MGNVSTMSLGLLNLVCRKLPLECAVRKFKFKLFNLG